MIGIRNTFLNKRLPQFLGVFVLSLSIITIFWLSGNTILFGTKAATDNTPKDIRISNVTDNTFTVSYVTDDSVNGSISYGTDTNLGKVVFDVRDGISPTSHNVHYVTISNLTPSTKYFFEVTSGDESFTKDTIPFEITTATSSADAKSQIAISGKVNLADGSIPSEALVYIQTDQPVSTFLKPDGSYELMLTVSKDTPLKMTVINSTLQSNVSFVPAQANPLPPIILSKNYDFSINNQPLNSITSDSAQISGFSIPETNTSAQGPQILTPKTSQEFKDQQPLFEGKALPQNNVEITIESEPIITTVQTDQNGNWKFRPDTKLAPGVHKITIKSLNSNGILQTITRSFTVFAEGSQFVEPSVSPTVPLTATPTPTPSPTIQPTTIVTAIPTPIIVTTAPVISSAATTQIPNITTPPIPNAGSSSLLFGIFGLGSIIGIGSLLFFLL